MTEIPVNCLFNKKKTGCGATELAIRNSIPTLIAMPYVALVKNKTVCRTDDIEVLGVYEDITEWDITQFARTHSPLKIATTYDSLPRVVSALQSIGIDPYKELFLLVDEWHVLFNSYSFRHRAIRELLATAARFDQCDLHDGNTHRAGIHVGGTAPPADLRNRLTRPYGGQSPFAADQ